MVLDPTRGPAPEPSRLIAAVADHFMVGTRDQCCGGLLGVSSAKPVLIAPMSAAAPSAPRDAAEALCASTTVMLEDRAHELVAA